MLFSSVKEINRLTSKEKLTFSKLLKFSKFKKFVSRSVFEELKLMQISMN